MDKVRLGKTEITVCRNGFGALPVQRISTEDAVYLIRKAFDNGITFFDTARAYTDSEYKLGIALKGIRDKVYVATKTMSTTLEGVKKDLETSLTTLDTDYIDIYQFHNPSFCPSLDSDIYQYLLEAKREGKIRHIGITNHRLDVANEAIDSGLYETLQFPFSYISGDKELELVTKCKSKDMGFIAMKGLSGGLLTNSRACYAFMRQFTRSNNRSRQKGPLLGVLPWLRLLHALSCGNRDQPVRPHGPDDKTCSRSRPAQ